MASIVKRRNKYCVVYKYKDEKGKEKQRWESFDTKREAKARKIEVEHEQSNNTFLVPTAKTVDDLLKDYMELYGVNSWSMSTYEGRKGLIKHYISPIIGNTKLEDVTPRMMDQYYRILLKVKMVSINNVKTRSEYLTAHTVREIHKLLRNAFHQAVRWELMARNPVENASLPKEKHEERSIWDAETLFKAIDLCDDADLKLALNLAFVCTLRMGEMLGLTWDCIDISEESIEAGTAYIYVNKELQRVNRNTMEILGDKGVIRKFPSIMGTNTTVLLLKEPKTETSVRKVFLPKTVAEMLVERKKQQEELKVLLGEEYYDYDLVFTSPNGRPMESTCIHRNMKKLIKENDLPYVVFHSIRHTSITYKLKLNGGDMKSVQGDSGHAQMKMVADVYSHILDDDRMKNAQRMENAFYSPNDPKNITDKAEIENKVEKESPEADAQELVRLLQKPEMAALLKTLAKTL